MKKLNTKIFTALMAVAVITLSLAFFFTGCKKEETIKSEILNEPEVEKDYAAYIEELMATTGINIYELSQLKEIQKVADKNMRMMAAFENTNAKGAFTDEKIEQIQYLAAAIEAAYEAGNDEEVLILYESLCMICMSIDGFIFSDNEYGVQTFTYDPGKEPISLPINFMEAERTRAELLVAAIETTYPSFRLLPDVAKQDVLAASLYLNVQQIKAKERPSLETVHSCLTKADNDHAIATMGTTAGYLIGVGLCGGTIFLSVVCVAVATSGYAAAIAQINSTHKARVQLCNLQGYY